MGRQNNGIKIAEVELDINGGNCRTGYKSGGGKFKSFVFKIEFFFS